MRQIVVNIALGTAFGLAGFLIESINNIFKYKRFVYAGDSFLWGIPFLPIYAIGGLMMHWVLKLTQGSHWAVVIFSAWLTVSVWEFWAGWFCERIMGRRFWDYRKYGLHIKGYVWVGSLLGWLLLVILYYVFIFEKAMMIERWLI